jgi:hypothetical protein
MRRVARIDADRLPVMRATMSETPRGILTRLDGLRGRGRPSPMDALSLFGLFAVTAMLVCYALEDRSRWFLLAFAGACVLGWAYMGSCRALGHLDWSKRFGPL